MSLVTGFFSSRGQAEEAINQLRKQGFDREISLVAKGEEGRARNNNADVDTVSDGVTAGAALGSLAGLALGAGALAIPGFGPLLAAGPVAGLLSGAATGGVAGGLADYGIPAERGKEFEERIRQGKMLVSVETNNTEEAAQALRQAGGENVETH